MAVCSDRLCDAYVNEACNSLVPNFCGNGRGLSLPSVACGNITFTGISDVTIEKGESIDLTEGVHAYDGNGNEIGFTVKPSTIDTSVPGTYEVTYTASGVSTLLKPTFCNSDIWSVYLTDCGEGIASAVRTVIVKSDDAVTCESAVCDSSVVC